MERYVGNDPTTQVWKTRMYPSTPISHMIPKVGSKAIVRRPMLNALFQQNERYQKY
jgi:hypothetical protein